MYAGLNGLRKINVESSLVKESYCVFSALIESNAFGLNGVKWLLFELPISSVQLLLF